MTPWHEEPGVARAFCIVLEALRGDVGNSVTILCDNTDATYQKDAVGVEVVAEWTGWEPRRFYGASPFDAIRKAGIEQAVSR